MVTNSNTRLLFNILNKFLDRHALVRFKHRLFKASLHFLILSSRPLQICSSMARVQWGYKIMSTYLIVIKNYTTVLTLNGLVICVQVT